MTKTIDFAALNLDSATAVHVIINNYMSPTSLSYLDFNLIKNITAPLFDLQDGVYEVWTDPDSRSFSSSPWDQRVDSAEEFALCALSIMLETSEFEIATDNYDETYHKVAHFMAEARSAGITRAMFEKHLNFLCRGNDDVNYMIRNLL
jgi:hypothetical protein